MFPAAPLAHLLLETIGVVLALEYYRRLRRESRDPVSDAHRTTLLLAAAFGAFAGSRLLGSLEQPDLFLNGGGPVGWTYYLRAKTIVGGFLGGLWAVELAKRIVDIRRRTGDVYAYPLILATMVGRLGCFLMGVQEPTYGVATDFFLGMDLGDGLQRHPTALYEIAFLGTLWVALRWADQRWELAPGRVFAFFMIAYLIWRFAVGFIQPLTPIVGLGAIQWACLLGLTWYLIDTKFLDRRSSG